MGKQAVTKVLLTGPPGCGKTTVIRRTLSLWPGPAGGFYTEEICADNQRQGFALVTLDGRRGVLAHVDRRGQPRVSKYGVDVQTMECLAVTSIELACERQALVVIDEIGPMELYSDRFRAAVQAALDGPRLLLGTIMQRSQPFANAIKARPDVRLIMVTPENRDHLPLELVRWLRESQAEG